MEYSAEHLKDEVDSLKQRIKQSETNIDRIIALLERQSDVIDNLISIVETQIKSDK